MPTGYTANTADGNGESFRDFILHLSRGMGAYVHQRDDHPQTLPAERVPSDYYFTAMKAARVRLETVLNWTERDKEDNYLAEKNQYAIDEAKYKRDSEEIARRYDERLEEVMTAEWPKDDDNTDGFFEGLRKFAIGQIESGKKFDAHYRPSTPFEEVYPTVDRWYNLKVEAAGKSLEYASKSLADEFARCRKVNYITARLYKWVDEFGEE
jgi:hypothetical protein